MKADFNVKKGKNPHCLGFVLFEFYYYDGPVGFLVESIKKVWVRSVLSKKRVSSSVWVRFYSNLLNFPDTPTQGILLPLEIVT